MNRPIRAPVRAGLGLAVTVFIAAQVSPAQEGSVVSLTGTYDLDQDGLSEFLALETVADHQKYPYSVVYKEIGADGTHHELWRFSPGRPLKDARMADTDGDGTPEVVVMEVPAAGTLSSGRPWLHVFPWKDGQFAREPEVQWGDQPLDEKLALRPSHFAIVDVENDGRDEIAVSLGSPRRELVILTLLEQPSGRVFSSRTLPLTEQIASGYGHILLVAGDQNQDGYTDLLALNNELTRIETQLFEGTGSELQPGPFHDQSTGDLDPAITGIIPSSLHRVDANRDGAEELLVPSRERPTLAITLEAGVLRILPTEPELSALFAFPVEGLQPAHVNDILLARAELGITGRKIRQLKMEAVTPEVSEPAPAIEEPAPVSPARRVIRLELEALEREEESLETTEEPTEESMVPPDTGFALEPAEDEAEPTAPRRVRKLALESVTREELPEPPPSVEIEIPPDIEISDTIRVGQTFQHSLVLEIGEKLHAFRPTDLPGGASFDPATRAITWTPTRAQVGLHTLAYDLEYEVGGKVDVEETGETVQVVTKTETRSVQRYIIVLEAQTE